ncbi:FecR family protein [Sinomicrobium kalidii]|uniref:FecR family protein n=1 Tax=Sinomicrobium kalidii TaxID=2900738 RepID=UPI001E31DB6D|nr:FecR family protein [Sinomicrobium kalidii]UGU17899.1 FecR family protein [Sinomicrobium kalidii]
MTEKQFRILLDKFLRGEASPREKELIRKFEKHFLDKNLEKTFADTGEKSQVQRDIYKNIKKRVSPAHFPWMQMAASLMAFVSIGCLLFYFINSPAETEISNRQSTPKAITLPDGSVVKLNKNSRLTYTEDFNKDNRHITLSGEAFFKVDRNSGKPFIIKTGELNTRVVGTQFNIREEQKQITVTVTEGLVKVYHENDTLQLKPDQQARFNTASKQLRGKEVKATLYSLWQNNKVVLNRITVEDLSVVLWELYRVKTVFKDEASRQTLLSIAFEREEALEQIIRRINLINEVKLTKNQNHMIEVEQTE